MTRTDETWHRLLEWTTGQPDSERLAALVLDDEGYTSIDPSHPLGGKDGGADALVKRDGAMWIMAVYFPRGQQTLGAITKKLTDDITSAKVREPDLAGVVFVTNQELRLAERKDLRALGDGIGVDLIHLERMASVLDRPRMAPVREQFLDIEAGTRPLKVLVEMQRPARAFVRTDDVLDWVVAIHERDLRDRNEKNKLAPERDLGIPPSMLLSAMGYSEPDRTVLSAAEMTADVFRFRQQLAARWPSCQDYLARIAWPAIHFAVANGEQSFLTDVEIIITFHGARGLECEDIGEFELERLQDPSWEPPAGPFGMLPSYMPKLTAKGHPVSWHNNESGDLEVTINLPWLRPHPPARLNYDDVVVIVDEPDRKSVIVTYTVTAQGYGTVFEGDPIELPIERTDMAHSVRAALAAVTSDD